MNCPFRGSYVALPTPFRGGEVDFVALDRLVELHVERGSDGLVAAGTSGEAATLSDYERRSVIERVAARSARRLCVLAGTGTNDTKRTVALTRFAAGAGADGCLVVTPYYNKPTQRGLVAHFGEIAAASELPLVLYNIPGRTGVDMKPATVAQIRASFPNAVAIKEASGSLGRARELREACDIALFAGEDALVADFMALGGVGVIGVVANVAPREVAELCRVARPGGDPMRTAEIAAFLAPLIEALFVETNPVPLKAALAAMGLCSDEVRLPLVGLEDASRARVIAALHEAALL